MAQPQRGGKEVVRPSATQTLAMGDAQDLEVKVRGKDVAVANWGSTAVHATDAWLRDWSWGCDSACQSDSVAWTAVQSNEAAQSLHHCASLWQLLQLPPAHSL